MSSKQKIETPAIPDWQERLLEERKELLDRLIKLKNFMDSPDTKMNRQEWEMLAHQYPPMREYLQVLTDRCIYYKLIKSADLNLGY